MKPATRDRIQHLTQTPRFRVPFAAIVGRRSEDPLRERYRPVIGAFSSWESRHGKSTQCAPAASCRPLELRDPKGSTMDEANLCADCLARWRQMANCNGSRTRAVVDRPLARRRPRGGTIDIERA